MKRQSYIIRLFAIAITASASLSGCGNDDDVVMTGIPEPSDVEIIPQAKLTASRADKSLSGIVDGTTFPASTDRVFAVSAFMTDNDNKYGWDKIAENQNQDATNGIGLDVPYFLNQPLRTDEEGTFHFNTTNGVRYYPEDGSHVYFYAFSPACATQDATDHKRVSWTLTGQEDIMAARDLRGIRKAHGSDLDAIHQPQPEFTFKHLLTRLNFRCRRETGFADYIYITSISFKNRNTTATLNLDDDTKLEFSNRVDELRYTLAVPHMVQLAEGYNEITSITIEPDASYDIVIGLKSGLTVEFTIEATKLTWDADDQNHGSGEIDRTGFKQGCSYNVNMRFEGSEITLDNVTVAPWNDGGSTSGRIIPDYD